MVPEAETRGVLPGAKDGRGQGRPEAGRGGKAAPRGLRWAGAGNAPGRHPDSAPPASPIPNLLFRSFVRAFVGTNTSVRKIPVGGGGGVFPAPAPCEAFSGFLAGTEARQVRWDPAIPQGGSRWHFPLFVGEAFVPAKKMLNVYIRSLLHIGLPLRSFEEGFRELTAGPPDRLTA